MLRGQMPQLPSSLSGPLANSPSLLVRAVDMWDRPEMSGIPETDENFEIVASTIKCIYDQTCRKCAGLNRTITYQPKDGRIQRKIRIEHNKGDTPAYLWNRQKERDQQHGRDKRQVEAPSTRSDKRPHDGDPWPDQQWTGGNWWQHGSGSGSSSRWNWRK